MASIVFIFLSKLFCAFIIFFIAFTSRSLRAILKLIDAEVKIPKSFLGDKCCLGICENIILSKNPGIIFLSIMSLVLVLESNLSSKGLFMCGDK